jgi:uncharacterized membrane protein YfcA
LFILGGAAGGFIGIQLARRLGHKRALTLVFAAS